jgi:hypothetical protein
MIGPLFRPHITLTSFGDRPNPRMHLTFEPLVFDAGSIAICELGPHHSCQRKVAEFPLQKRGRKDPGSFRSSQMATD